MGKMVKKKVKKKPFTSTWLYWAICALTSIPGLFILLWCGYSKGNPFPYASVIGLILMVAFTIFITVTDKTKWVKGRENYQGIGNGFSDF